MIQAHHNFQRQLMKHQGGKMRQNFCLPMNIHCGAPQNFRCSNPNPRENHCGLSKPQIPIGKEVKMVSSPEIKINLENVEQQNAFFPKQFSCYPPQNQRCSYETLRTASTSTESLLSVSNSSSTMTNVNNMVRSQENLLIQPFSMNMCNGYFHKRGISMNNLMASNLGEQRQFAPILKKPTKCYYNKFNSPTENSNNENTVILTLKIKIGKNDYRIFNLKKFDDLFISLQKFFDMNQIKQELIKPIVTKIFNALNKIFWVLNNKIGLYDQEYLASLYKVWLKNKGRIPKPIEQSVNNSKKAENKSFTEGYEDANKKPTMNKSF